MKRWWVVWVSACVACSPSFNSSGSGPASLDVTVSSPTGESRTTPGMVGVTFTTRASTYSSAPGFLDLRIGPVGQTVGGVRCPLLLDAEGAIVPGRSCVIEGVTFPITGGSVSGSSLRVESLTSSFNTSGDLISTRQVTLQYPAVTPDAGVAADADADATTDAASPQDAPVLSDVRVSGDASSVGTQCDAYCARLANICGTLTADDCSVDCRSLFNDPSSRCGTQVRSLQQCAPSSQVSCGVPYFTSCTSLYQQVSLCTRGF